VLNRQGSGELMILLDWSSYGLRVIIDYLGIANGGLTAIAGHFAISNDTNG